MIPPDQPSSRPPGRHDARTLSVPWLKPLYMQMRARSRNGGSPGQSRFASAWLAQHGVVPVGSGSWAGPDPWGGRVHTSNDVAHAWTSEALTDSALDQLDRLYLALGLLELLDDYWVACEIGWRMRQTHDASLVTAFWDSYRHHLESTQPPEAVRYSLWVDWFEDPSTVKTAFAEVLGNDVERLRGTGRLAELTDGPLFRRAERVLQDSGPVPWTVKYRLYVDLATLETLHPALFCGILASYHDVHGDLDPIAALDLLRRLRLPADTTHRSRLESALATGAVSHHRSPYVWNEARSEDTV